MWMVQQKTKRYEKKVKKQNTNHKGDMTSVKMLCFALLVTWLPIGRCKIMKLLKSGIHVCDISLL